MYKITDQQIFFTEKCNDNSCPIKIGAILVNPYCLKMLSHPDSTIYTFKINDWIDPPPDDKCYSERVITSITINYTTVCGEVRDITKLSGYPRSNVKTRLEQSNLFLASGRFALQNAIYDNKLPFSRM